MKFLPQLLKRFKSFFTLTPKSPRGDFLFQFSLKLLGGNPLWDRFVAALLAGGRSNPMEQAVSIKILLLCINTNLNETTLSHIYHIIPER